MSEKNLDLSFFMPGNAEEVEEIEVVVTKRFKDKEGKPVPFILKPVSTELVEELEDECTKSIIRKNKVVGKEVDRARFMARIGIESTIYPNFKSAELRKAYKTEDAVEVAKKVLCLAGEYSEWIEKITEINGFDDTDEELEEYAKN